MIHKCPLAPLERREQRGNTLHISWAKEKGKSAHVSKFPQETGQSLTEKPTDQILDAVNSTQASPHVNHSSYNTPWQKMTEKSHYETHGTSTQVTTESQHETITPRPPTCPAPCNHDAPNKGEDDVQKLKKILNVPECPSLSHPEDAGPRNLEKSASPHVPKTSRRAYLQQQPRYHSGWTTDHLSPLLGHKWQLAPLTYQKLCVGAYLIPCVTRSHSSALHRIKRGRINSKPPRR